MDIEVLKEKQNELRRKVILKPLDTEIKYIAGCDSAFRGELINSVFVILEYKTLRVVEIKNLVSHTDFPYIPGFLAFREAPNLLNVYKTLSIKPDLIMVDGHGISHPRGLGIASHLGVLLNIPTIGVAKSLLVGKYKKPCMKKGCSEIVYFNGKVVAYALRSKDDTQEIFVSPGHLIDLNSALSVVLNTLRGYRLPEPIRLADYYSRKF
ncbi:MAG: deoxyribonuclease V [candidate division WOR-3 bacterium]|nr:deoxyribonuclease V [candidate division WOR-3 bacterium]